MTGEQQPSSAAPGGDDHVDREVDQILLSSRMEGQIASSAGEQALRDYAHGTITQVEYFRRRGLDSYTINLLLHDSIADRDERWRAIEDRFGLYTAAEVADLVGSVARNRSEYATVRHRKGALMAIRRRGQLLFPGFQFDPDRSAVRSVVPQLIRVFTAVGWSHESMTQWCAAPQGYLDDDVPADVMGVRPVDVLEAARDVAATW